MTGGTGKVLAVITARGGSKSLPRKNILPLAGKPLIAHSIEAARNAKLLDRWIVSTDDSEIAEVARGYGADVPFTRPAELAMDDTLSFPVLRHGMVWLEENQGYIVDYAMWLQPTSALLTGEDIDESIAIALENNATGVVSLCPSKHHPHWAKRVTDDGQVQDFVPLERPIFRRQELEPAYALNGAINLIRRDVLLEHETGYGDRLFAYKMPPERSLDIDTLWDFRLAELILQGRFGDESDKGGSSGTSK